jgi:hypothetical protein
MFEAYINYLFFKDPINFLQRKKPINSTNHDISNVHRHTHTHIYMQPHIWDMVPWVDVALKEKGSFNHALAM